MTMKKWKIGILTSSDSWMAPYFESLRRNLELKGHSVSFATMPDELREPLDVVFILSYKRILPGDFLKKHRHNLVVHASDLPKGRGWSPLNRQILEGANEIPVCLFEAEESLDTGDIYIREKLVFEGHELLPEMLDSLAKTINQMIISFLDDYENVMKNARKQVGEPTFYNRRRPKDSELDIDGSIREQFNLLRVVDNERYPAFFKHEGHIYILKIQKKDS